MSLKKLFGLVPPTRQPLGVEPGLYHYVREVEGAITRFHLRADSTGGGLLLANASAAARLRPSGVLIAKGLLENDDEETILARLKKTFRGVAAEQAAEDIRRVRGILASLETPGDNFPILNLADPSFSPEANPLDKPLSADVPLAEPERIVPILDRLWDLGIPHVTFVPGEHPDAGHLVRAVERTEDLGMIAGVRVSGTDLAAGTLLADLATAGVDHLDVLFLSADRDTHDTLTVQGDYDNVRRAWDEIRKQEICPLAEVALVEATVGTVAQTIEALVAAGVGNIGFFALATGDEKALDGAVHADQLPQVARQIEEAAEEHDARLLWYPPVCRDEAVPLTEQIRQGPRTSGDQTIRVEPDGAVFVARGPRQPVGNLLADEWKTIREHDIYRAYRRRVETDTHCVACPGLAICAADCPRDPAGWADGA